MAQPPRGPIDRLRGLFSPRPVEKAPDPAASEMGWTGLQSWGGRIDDDPLTLLRGGRRDKIYEEMSSNDPIIGAMLFALEALMRPMSWTVEPGGETPEDLKAADYLGSVLEDMSHTMADFLSEWMAAPVFGYAPFEIVLKKRQGPQREPGKSSKYTDGLVGVRKLAIRHPLTRDKWEFDEAGGIQGFTQFSSVGKPPVTIPIEKLLLFRIMARKGSPEGTSILRRAYTSWYRKKRIEDIESIGIERDLNGLPVIYHPAEWRTDTRYSSILSETEKLVTRIKNDEQAGVALPAIYDENGNQLLRLELLASPGRRNFDTSAVIERLSRHMLMVALADVIVLGHESVGSFSLAESKSGLFLAGIGSMADDIESVLNRHLVPRLMAINGFSVESPPKFRHGDIQSVNLTEIADYIQKLSMAGFPLFPTESGELERELLRAANLPADELGRPQPPPEPFRAADEGEDPEPD